MALPEIPATVNDSYALFFINSAIFKDQPLAPISLLFLFLGRILPIIALSPFLGARVLPHPVKLTLALSLFVIYLPQLLLSISTPILFNQKLIFLLLKELLVGSLIGFIISIPFTIVQSAGIIVDHQRGGASLMVNDPTVQNQSSPLGTLYNMVLICIFFMINGPFLLFDTLSSSFDILPLDHFLPASFFNPSLPIWKSFISLLNTTMVSCIRLAMPSLLAILMTDMFLGIANRLAPQVQITFLGMPLKSLLGLMVITIGWNLLTQEFARESIDWIRFLRQVVSMMRPSPAIE